MFWRSFAISLCGFCLLFRAAACPAAERAPGFTPLPEPKALPGLVLQDIKGRERLLVELFREKKDAAQFVFLHLWAPRCPACQPEMRSLEAAWPLLKAAGIEVIALAQDPDGAITVPAFAKRHEVLSLPLYIDREQQALKSLKSPGLPISYALDSTGRIIAVHTGSIDWLSWVNP